MVCLDGAAGWSRLAPAPPVHLSLAEARLLLCAVLPLPRLDVPATLDLLRYQHWRKMAAYLSHRRRILRRLDALPRSKVSL